MKKPKGEYSIQAVINALRLLEEFSNSEELGVTELSRRLGLHKNNVFRLLATLEQRGYIEQSDEKRYRLGFRILELGRSFSRSRNLLKRARPLLVELAEQTGESAHLGSMHGFEVVHLDGVATDRLVGSGTRVGCRLPLHTTALGKVPKGDRLGAGRTQAGQHQPQDGPVSSSRRSVSARGHTTPPGRRSPDS